jgi:hypothetical protein
MLTARSKRSVVREAGQAPAANHPATLADGAAPRRGAFDELAGRCRRSSRSPFFPEGSIARRGRLRGGRPSNIRSADSSQPFWQTRRRSARDIVSKISGAFSLHICTDRDWTLVHSLATADRSSITSTDRIAWEPDFATRLRPANRDRVRARRTHAWAAERRHVVEGQTGLEYSQRSPIRVCALLASRECFLRAVHAPNRCGLGPGSGPERDTMARSATSPASVHVNRL